MTTASTVAPKYSDMMISNKSAFGSIWIEFCQIINTSTAAGSQ